MQEHKSTYKNLAQSDHNFIIHQIPANTSHSITIIDLDHVRQLIMRHEAQERETTIYLLPWTRSPMWDYSQIIPEEGMAMKSLPGSISPDAECRDQLQNHPRTRVSGDGTSG